MSKKIGLWIFASLLIAGVATGAYMYSNGGYHKIDGSCSTNTSELSTKLTADTGKDADCGRDTRAMYTMNTRSDKTAAACPITGAVVSTATLTPGSEKTGCCAGETAGATETLHASAMTDAHESCEKKHAEHTSSKTEHACAGGTTATSSGSDAPHATVIATSSK